MAAVPANSSLSSSSLSSSSLSRRESLPGWAGSASWQQAQLFLPMVVLQAQSHRACTQMLQVHAVQVCTSKLRCDDVHGLLMILIMHVTNLPCAEKRSSPHCHVMLSACKNASAKEHQSKKLTATAMQIEPLSTDTLPCFASVQKRTVASHGQKVCCRMLPQRVSTIVTPCTSAVSVIAALLRPLPAGSNVETKPFPHYSIVVQINDYAGRCMPTVLSLCRAINNILTHVM